MSIIAIFSTIHTALSQSNLLCHGCWATFLNLLHDVSKLWILLQLCQLLLNVGSVTGIVHALHEIGHLWVLLLQPQKQMLVCCNWPVTYMLNGDSIKMLGSGCSACETHSADDLGTAVLWSSCDCEKNGCYQAANQGGLKYTPRNLSSHEDEVPA